MKILFIGNYPCKPDGPLTGPERPTVSLIQGIGNLVGYEGTVIIPIRFRAPFEKIKVSSRESTTIISAHAKDLFRLIRDIQPQIIHVSGITYFGMLAMLFSRLYFKKIRTVYLAHGILAEEAKYGESFPIFERTIERILMKYSTVIVTASVISRSYVIRHYNRDPDKVKVISYGLDTRLIPEISSDGEQFRKKYGLIEKHIILFIARLVPLKGLHFLVEACMQGLFLDYRLVVIGNRSEYWDSLVYKYPDFFQKHVLRLNTMGPEELAQVYSACSLLVLPSRYEPFGLVALEAMAFSKPVIVSDRVGMGYLIDSGINGVIIPFGDVSALVEALNYLLANDELRKAIGERAHRTAMATTAAYHVDRFIELYKSLIAL
jgi:glycosyltransferase involved in cell wall biosynthesis